MGHAFMRRSGATALVYVLFNLGVMERSAAAQGNAALRPLTAPIELTETETAPGVVVFPARLPGPRGLTVVLHGMCSEPERVCARFAEQVTRSENLVCPRATRRCRGGGSIWPGLGFREQIDAAVERAKAALPEAADETRGRTLIGYSLGAFRALDVAETSQGRYPRVMLIGAKIFPNLTRLRDNHVARLLLAAGEWDMMHDHMQHQNARLVRQGYASTFLGLGKVGHFFTPSFAEYLPTALEWLNGDTRSSPEGAE